MLLEDRSAAGPCASRRTLPSSARAIPVLMLTSSGQPQCGAMPDCLLAAKSAACVKRPILQTAPGSCLGQTLSAARPALRPRTLSLSHLQEASISMAMTTRSMSSIGAAPCQGLRPTCRVSKQSRVTVRAAPQVGRPACKEWDVGPSGSQIFRRLLCAGLVTEASSSGAGRPHQHWGPEPHCA